MPKSMGNTHQQNNPAAASNIMKKDQKASRMDNQKLQGFTPNDDDSNKVYDNDDDDDDVDVDDEDEDDDDEFSPHQRMPTQHPATRTCFQLLGRLSILL